MVIKLMSEKNSDFERIIQGKAYGGILTAFVREIKEEDSDLKQFLNNFDCEKFHTLEIREFLGHYFVGNLQGGPSFSITIRDKDNSNIGSFKIVVTPNCCGLCHICELSLYSAYDDNVKIFLYEKCMLLALGLCSRLSYSKVIYTDAIINDGKTPSARLKYYFGYNIKTKEISHPYWTKLSETVSKKTHALLLIMESDLSEPTKKYHNNLVKRLNNIINNTK